MLNRYKDAAIGVAVITGAIAFVFWAAVTGADPGQLMQQACTSAIILTPRAAVLMLIATPVISAVGALFRRP